ncbi:MAG: electron transport complex subunit RsxC [bacterium]|nr:electron transport complex subunit RsxC [bacterium]
MRLYTFRGGVHPSQCKNLTQGKPIEEAPTPKIAVIPLAQHTGAPAKPLVKPKDEVKIGTKIGDIQGRISASVHSSISGVVKSIEPRYSPAGITTLSAIIESNNKNEYDKPIELKDYDSLTPSQIVNIVKKAGIVGLGGAAFPTHVKLSPPKDKPVDTVILNGAECEPYLTADHRLMVEHPKEILEGGKLILKALNAKIGYIAIEENKPDAIEKFVQIAPEFKFKLCIMHTKYPQGGEKQLIKAITKREVPSGGLPFDIGVYVQNVGTAFAIYEACKHGKPLIQRIITVTGKVKEPKNLRVKIGTPFKDLIEFCGGYNGEPDKIIMGGPMMGIAQPNDEAPVIKATTGILVLGAKRKSRFIGKGKDSVSIFKEEVCIRCGSCVEVCPMGLLPCTIGDYVANKKIDRAKEYGILDCIECGSCAWVCPANRNLIHLFKYGKLILQK